MAYVSSPSDASDACVFCDHLAENDDESARILHRATTCFVILNAYPYNTGHLLVAPARHVPDVAELDPIERAELFEIATQSMEVVRVAMQPEGFNLGVNIGAAAGAGIPGHVHLHVVPRWSGDTNFMPVTGDTKVLPELIADTYAKLRPLFTDPE